MGMKKRNNPTEFVRLFRFCLKWLIRLIAGF